MQHGATKRSTDVALNGSATEVLKTAPARLDTSFAGVVTQCGSALSAGASVTTCLATAGADLVSLAASVAAAACIWPSNAETYARRLLACCPTTGVARFAVVSRQGQMSSIHDHGTWGAVTVVRGLLHEQVCSGSGATLFQTDALQGGPAR